MLVHLDRKPRYDGECAGFTARLSFAALLSWCSSARMLSFGAMSSALRPFTSFSNGSAPLCTASCTISESFWRTAARSTSSVPLTVSERSTA